MPDDNGSLDTLTAIRAQRELIESFELKMLLNSDGEYLAPHEIHEPAAKACILEPRVTETYEYRYVPVKPEHQEMVARAGQYAQENNLPSPEGVLPSEREATPGTKREFQKVKVLVKRVFGYKLINRQEQIMRLHKAEASLVKKIEAPPIAVISTEEKKRRIMVEAAKHGVMVVDGGMADVG